MSGVLCFSAHWDMIFLGCFRQWRVASEEEEVQGSPGDQLSPSCKWKWNCVSVIPCTHSTAEEFYVTQPRGRVGYWMSSLGLWGSLSSAEMEC